MQIKSFSAMLAGLLLAASASQASPVTPFDFVDEEPAAAEAPGAMEFGGGVAASSLAPAPLPPALALSGVGLAALGLAGRRRRRGFRRV